MINIVYLCGIATEKPMERKRLNRLKVVLAEKGVTNKRLAELVGKDPAMVSKWATNTAQPNVEMLMLIAKVLDVSVDELLRTDEEFSPRLKTIQTDR